MISELAFTTADKIISRLPSVILHRYYSKMRLDKEVLIDTRSTNPLSFVLGTYLPMVHGWFTVTNFTNLAWRVHEFTVQILLQQQFFAFAKCYDKPDEGIRPKGRSDVFTTCMLNELQVIRLRELQQSKSAVATLYVNAQLESKIGLIEFARTITNRQPQIE